MTVDSDGTAGGGTTKYYKIGEDITLTGNWYNVGTAAALGTSYASTTGVKMTSSLNGAVIYDNYYKVTSSVVTVAAGKEYVIATGTSEALVTSNGFSKYAVDADGTYVMLDATGKIATPTRDYNIIGEGYVLVSENVTVTHNADGKLNGMTVNASVAPKTYVKAGDTITVSLSLVTNGKASTGVVSVDGDKIQIGGKTATDIGNVSILDANSSSLKTNTFTFTVPGSMTDASGLVTVTIEVINA